jgi:aminodeoxyfutalosine synthase
MPSLETIRSKLEQRLPLSREEGMLLFDSRTDLHEVGRMADGVRKTLNGDSVYYNLNAHLNPTNICLYRCPLCAFSRDPGERGAYRLAEDAILRCAEEAASAGCTEIHVVGGIPAEVPYSWYRGILAMIHECFPRLQLKAWTAVEILHFSELSGMGIADVLEDLMTVGLSGLPGGGAEIFAPEIRKRIAPKKPNASAWLDVHRTAHRLGLPTNATMLFGHLESPEHRVDHLLKLRDLQQETLDADRPAHFEAFVPLAFHPGGTQFPDLPGPSPIDVLRTLATSRLLLMNIPHLKAYWISLGVSLAQIALGYGADDLDGTVRQERIHHDAGATSPQRLTIERIEHLIREAGRVPLQRDSHYRPIGK